MSFKLNFSSQCGLISEQSHTQNHTLPVTRTFHLRLFRLFPFDFFPIHATNRKESHDFILIHQVSTSKVCYSLGWILRMKYCCMPILQISKQFFDGFWQQTWLSTSVCSVKTAEVFWFSIVNRIFGSACLCNWVCLVCGCHKVSSVFGATVTNAIITWVLKRHLSFDIFRRLGCWDLHQIEYTIKFAYNACIDESPPRFKLPVEFVCDSQAYIWEGTMSPSQRTDSAKIWEMKAEMSPKRDRKIGDESVESQMMARKSVLKWILIDRQLIQATNRQQSNRMGPQITIDKVSQSHTS